MRQLQANDLSIYEDSMEHLYNGRYFLSEITFFNYFSSKHMELGKLRHKLGIWGRQVRTLHQFYFMSLWKNFIHALLEEMFPFLKLQIVVVIIYYFEYCNVSHTTCIKYCLE